VGNQRERIKLDDEEIRVYIERSRTLIMGTINHDGYPHLVPMWYGVLDGLIKMHTYRSSQKVVNLERDDRGSVLIEDGESYNELRGVFMRGRFEIIDDQELCFRIGMVAAEKYMGAGPGEAEPFVRRQVRKRVALVFHPEKFSSWDHRKISG
jgi:nitroimidazol reductase NimA-like FMN-containing flavoprotein (pyridoxamine 5'-phosphate oxidase superfamily)